MGKWNWDLGKAYRTTTILNDIAWNVLLLFNIGGWKILLQKEKNLKLSIQEKKIEVQWALSIFI